MAEFQATFTAELEFMVEGDFTPGRPATPPSYASGGDPPEPDEVEATITAIGVPYRHDTGRTDEKGAKVYEWKTRWLTLPPEVMKALDAAIQADDELREQAEDAIVEEARSGW